MPAQVSFEKGWLQREARHLFPQGSLVEALNVLNDETGALRTRNGHVLLGSTLQPVAPDKVTNGTFTGSAAGWTVGAAWAYNADAVDKNADGTSALSQGIGAVATKVYRVAYTISNWTVGTVTVSVGGSRDLTAVNTTHLVFSPTNPARFTIDSVSVYQLTADCHSLATLYTVNGVRVGYQGAETVLYRDFAAILAGLDGTPIEFASLRGNGEQTEYMFFANGQEALRVKDSGTALTRWGIASPANAPTFSGFGTLQTKSIDTFDSATVATDYTPASCTLTRDLVNKQEGTSALSMAVPASSVGGAIKALGAPVNLTVFASGAVSTDADAIRCFLYVSGLANIAGLFIGLNFSAGTQFIDGYFAWNIDLRTLNQGENIWTEILLPKSDFVRVGSAAGGWDSINGVELGGSTSAGGAAAL